MVSIDVSGLVRETAGKPLVMWPYWIMFLILALPAMESKEIAIRKLSIAWLFVGVLLVLFIGLRYEVGGDWGAYIRHFQIAKSLDFTEVILQSDPGYVYLNWQIQQWGLSIYAVNLISSIIFITGLIAFAVRRPFPWLALVVAFPYVVLVLGMGYTRQGVALGFIFFALNALQSEQFRRYLLFIALATLFHKTALIMIPLGIFFLGRGWLIRVLAILAASYVLFDLLVSQDVDDLWSNYVDAQMISQGARIRVLMNLVPGLLVLVYWRTWKDEFPNYWMWFWIAIGSVACVLLVGFASTAVDRISLYFIPIQIVVFSRLPYLLRHQFSPDLIRYGIVAGYALVLYVWLNYALHAQYWLPYQNVLFL